MSATVLRLAAALAREDHSVLLIDGGVRGSRLGSLAATAIGRDRREPSQPSGPTEGWPLRCRLEGSREFLFQPSLGPATAAIARPKSSEATEQLRRTVTDLRLLVVPPEATAAQTVSLLRRADTAVVFVSSGTPVRALTQLRQHSNLAGTLLLGCVVDGGGSPRRTGSGLVARPVVVPRDLRPSGRRPAGRDPREDESGPGRGRSPEPRP